MSSIKWGPPTWILMHTLIETINKKNVNFNNIKIQLFNIIKNICLFSSCPIAWHNSMFFFDKADHSTLNNINDFKNFLYIFHNFINKKKNTLLFNYNNMNVYENYNITIAYNNFVNAYVNNNIQINIKMKQTIKELNNFIIFLSQTEYKKEEIKIVKNVENAVVEEIKKDEIKIVEIKIVENAVVDEIKKEEIKIVEETEKVDEIKKEENIVLVIVEEENVVSEEIKTDENFDKIENDITIKLPSSNNFPKGLSFLDDKILPAFDLNFTEALLEISKNPKCVPFQVYIDRWKYFNKKHIEKQNRQNKNKNKNNFTNATVIIDESLLPPFNLSLPIAIIKIQNNPLCVPSDLYIKKWNEIKLLAKYKKHIKS